MSYRYIFGEIMYGGHITDKWDRRVNVTYLDVIVTPRLFESDFELFPNFKTKTEGTWEDYLAYIETVCVCVYVRACVCVHRETWKDYLAYIETVCERESDREERETTVEGGRGHTQRPSRASVLIS